MPPRRAAAVQAPAVHVDTRSTTKVIIACKVAVARLELQLCRKGQVRQQSQNGEERTVEQYFKTGTIWIVRGTAYPAGTPPKGFMKRPEEVNGYVLTKGVPKDFWDAWIEQNKQLPMVQNNLIFACDTYDEIDGMTEDHNDIRCGFAPLEMPERTGDPIDGRVPRPLQQDVGAIERMSQN